MTVAIDLVRGFGELFAGLVLLSQKKRRKFFVKIQNNIWNQRWLYLRVIVCEGNNLLVCKIKVENALRKCLQVTNSHRKKSITWYVFISGNTRSHWKRRKIEKYFFLIFDTCQFYLVLRVGYGHIASAIHLIYRSLEEIYILH